MTVRTSLAVIKLTSIVFLSASIVFAVKYYDSENHNQKLKDTNLLDKNTYVNELKEILYRYDKEIIKNKEFFHFKTNSISFYAFFIYETRQPISMIQ